MATESRKQLSAERAILFANKSRWRKAGSPRRSALTLLELVVVLVILTILATVAVASIEPQVAQAQYEATQKTLDNMRRSILGDQVARFESNIAVAGFVSDVGRIPHSLSELHDASTLPAFQLRRVEEGHSQFQPNAAGMELWVGQRDVPYLHLPLGAEEIRDGWGNPFQYSSSTASIISSGGPIEPYQNPVQLTLPYQMNLVVNVRQASTSTPATVFLLEPDLTAEGPDNFLKLTEKSAGPNCEFENVTVGKRLLRVIDTESNLPIDRYVTLHPGMEMPLVID